MAATPTPGNLLDELEEAFQNCLAPLTKEDNFNAVNAEELKTNADINSTRFLDLARQMEAFFLQKRYLLSIQKPELILFEDIIEMRNELSRKDELLKKHAEKLNEWQGLLSSMHSNLGTPASMGPRVPGPGGPGMHPSMMGGPAGSVPMPGLSPVGGMGPGPSPMGPNSMGPSGMGPSGPSMPHNMNPGMGIPQSSMMQMGGGGGSMGPGPGMGGLGGMSQGGYQGGPGGAMYSNMGPQQGGPPGGLQGPPGGLQGPLAYLEKTTTNIGMPEPRR